MNGHWFCSYCNDVKFLRSPDDAQNSNLMEKCPDCKNRAMHWVPDAPRRRPVRVVSATESAERFAEMRKAIQ